MIEPSKKNNDRSVALERSIRCRRPQRARQRSGQGQAARASAVRRDVHRQLHRPGEHRFRPHPHGNRPGHRRCGLRFGCRAVLRRLCAVRSAFKHASAALRCACLADPDHVHLGPGGHGHGLRSGRDQFLCHALPARRHRGRLLSRRALLLHPVVACQRTRQGHGDLPQRLGHRLDHFRPHHRRPAERDRAGPAWLAVDVPDRRRRIGGAVRVRLLLAAIAHP